MQGKPVSAGVYLYQIRTGEFVQTKKMVLLKQILIKTSSPTFVDFLFVGWWVDLGVIRYI